MIAPVCTFIIGSVLLFSGLVKTVDSRSFVRHVVRYNIIPPRILVRTCYAFIGLESAFGTAMILHMLPQWLVPVSMILFILFAGVTLWGTRTGRVEDCGCYGGLLALSPNQSALLDGAYVLILLPAWAYPIQNHQTAGWKYILPALVFILSIAVARKSLEKKLVEFSRLKKGRRWKNGWLKNSTKRPAKGPWFVVFLNKDCSWCKRWVPLLNVINVQPELPMVTGVMSLNGKGVDAFKKEHLIRFPIAYMDKYLMATMTTAFPTAVLVEDGTITEKWAGEMPKAYLNSIKQFYDGILRNTEKKPFSG